MLNFNSPSIERTIVFSPEPGNTYVVYGTLTDEKREVYLVDAEAKKNVETGEPVE